MAITRGTLQIARRLRKDIGVEVDAAVRTLTTEWVDAWDGLAASWRDAADELVTTAVRNSRWPRPNEILRMGDVDRAMRGSIAALDKLAERTETVAAAAADRVIQLDAEREARIIASQAPDAEEPGLARMLADRLGVQQIEAMREAWSLREQARDDVRLTVVTRIRTDAINVVTRRTGEQIHSSTVPLSPQAVDSMRRELIRGIDVGANPREAARRMVAGVQGQFNGGLTRAMTIARTETLDAYRATSQQIHTANADIVPGWQWLATYDFRVCPSCLSLSGSQYPASEPGPQDHQQGRCSRLPVLASWAELGITAPEPPSAFPGAEAWFARQPHAVQLQIMGPARLQLLDDGRIGWGDLSATRQTPGWRPSRVPTPVRDLQRRADRGLPPTPGPTTLTRPAAPRPRITTPTLPRAVSPPAPRTPMPQAARDFHRTLDGIEDLAAAVERGVSNSRVLTGGVSADTRLVTLADGRQVVQKSGGNADAEQLASLMANKLGIRAPRVYRDHPSQVWMDYVDDAVTADELSSTMVSEWDRRRRMLNETDDGQRAGLLDVLIGNVDRNLGNWMLTSDGRLVAIDHGHAWGAVSAVRPRPFTPTINGPFAGLYDGPNPLTRADVDEVRRRLEELRPDFAHLGRERWLEYSLGALDLLARNASGLLNIIAS